MIKRNFFFSEKIILKESKFYVEGHHEAIVSREVFEKAQELRISRNLKRAKVSTESNRVIIRRQYAFSCMLQCYLDQIYQEELGIAVRNIQK